MLRNLSFEHLLVPTFMLWKKCSFVYLEYQYSVFKKKSNGIWNASEFVLLIISMPLFKVLAHCNLLIEHWCIFPCQIFLFHSTLNLCEAGRIRIFLKSRVSRPLAPLIYVIRSGSYVKRSGPESLDFGKMELERVSLFWKIVNVNTPYLSHYV